jgi:tetratricopeptide (TPR) repeat protein
MTYGQSFAQKQLDLGNYEQALVEANRAIEHEADDPEPVLDRARVYQALGRWDEAVADIRRCLELDVVARVVDDSLVDDTLFSTLIGWGTELAKSDGERAVAVLEQYRAILPAGAHLDEVPGWENRFRGKHETWVKDRT